VLRGDQNPYLELARAGLKMQDDGAQLDGFRAGAEDEQYAVWHREIVLRRNL